MNQYTKNFALKHLLTFTLAVGTAGCPESTPPVKQPNSDLQSLDKEPNALDEDIERAQKALKSNDFSGAKTLAESVLKRKPQSADAHFVLGVCAEHAKNTDEAISHYQKAFDTDAKQASAVVNLSAILVEAKKFDDAVALLEKALASNGKRTELYVNLAYAKRGLNDHAASAKAFEKASELSPEQSSSWLLDWADELSAAGEKDAAIRTFKNAIAKNQDDTSVLTQAALGLAKLGDFASCVMTLDRAIGKQSSAELLTERAVCRMKNGDHKGAKSDADTALAQKALVKTHLIAALLAAHDKDKASCKSFIDKAIVIAQKTPGSPPVEAIEKYRLRCESK